MNLFDIDVISFDLDGTIIDYTFIDFIWFNEIPRLYSKRYHLPFDESLQKVTLEYNEIGESQIEWYQINYWFNRFKLNQDWRKILNASKNKIKIYPDVLDILNYLYNRYTLIINSNSPREFMDLELETTGIKHYFTRIFSSTSDFNQVKKSTSYYAKICEIAGVNPKRVLHIGDNWTFDYLIPKNLEIKTIFLDRSMKRAKDTHIICTLRELKDILPTRSRLNINHIDFDLYSNI